MATAEIKLRLAALEAEVAQLKQQLQKPVEPEEHWVTGIFGAFAGDEDFLEAMRLGRKYRESLRPKPRAKSAKRATKAKRK